jgi:hypothetical protein
VTTAMRTVRVRGVVAAGGIVDAKCNQVEFGSKRKGEREKEREERREREKGREKDEGA